MVQLKNCLTIDLESISHRYVTERRHLSEAGRRSVEDEEHRRTMDNGSVASSTRKMLEVLREYKCTVTFFVVGEVYNWYPDLVHELNELGHEVAYHSHTHAPFKAVDFLRRELQESRKLIEAFGPRGFRAPRATITRDCLGELARSGFVYDSSSYGPFDTSARMSGIIEVPISTYGICLRKPLTLPRPLSLALLRDLEIPFGSGYFISLFSSVNPTLVSYFVRKSNERGTPAVLSLHPWQLYRKETGASPSRGFARLGMLPYDRSCDQAFEHLLRSHSFCPMYELIEGAGIL